MSHIVTGAHRGVKGEGFEGEGGEGGACVPPTPELWHSHHSTSWSF